MFFRFSLRSVPFDYSITMQKCKNLNFYAIFCMLTKRCFTNESTAKLTDDKSKYLPFLRNGVVDLLCSGEQREIVKEKKK
ncbi:hypothetical protein T07_2528 [Trichinella nelsoni]|uniref:Uncharacterized protein n=1 Tax=Trichinella nelsoni TaxID=6336 RepID=A0A0V0SNC1_9BILA|nr:hypothetical protein T07_2528 [Trichinella nelsoni]